jgi:hypothetical protein
MLLSELETLPLKLLEIDSLILVLLNLFLHLSDNGLSRVGRIRSFIGHGFFVRETDVQRDSGLASAGDHGGTLAAAARGVDVSDVGHLVYLLSY